jgi:hypothetical protein
MAEIKVLANILDDGEIVNVKMDLTKSGLFYVENGELVQYQYSPYSEITIKIQEKNIMMIEEKEKLQVKRSKRK